MPPKKGYKKLSLDERKKLESMAKSGLSYSDMATILGRNKSTICRELKRNSTDGTYNATFAHDAFLDRLSHVKGPPNVAYRYLSDSKRLARFAKYYKAWESGAIKKIEFARFLGFNVHKLTRHIDIYEKHFKGGENHDNNGK